MLLSQGLYIEQKISQSQFHRKGSLRQQILEQKKRDLVTFREIETTIIMHSIIPKLNKVVFDVRNKNKVKGDFAILLTKRVAMYDNLLNQKEQQYQTKNTDLRKIRQNTWVSLIHKRLGKEFDQIDIIVGQICNMIAAFKYKRKQYAHVTDLFKKATYQQAIHKYSEDSSDNDIMLQKHFQSTIEVDQEKKTDSKVVDMLFGLMEILSPDNRLLYEISEDEQTQFLNSIIEEQ